MTVSGTKKKAGLAERLSQNSVFLSGAALVLSLIVAGIVMLIAGYSPIEGYSAMFTGRVWKRQQPRPDPGARPRP